jgi:hypothetical protein
MADTLVAGDEVIVVGAGVVGIAIALQLRLEGFAVTLLDRGEPAMETSYGNAGAFAISDVIPLAEPGVLRKVPGWMLDLGPLALRWRYLPSLMPWLLRFLAASRPSKVATLTRDLSALLGRVNQDYAALIDKAGLGPCGVVTATSRCIATSRSSMPPCLPGRKTPPWRAVAGLVAQRVTGKNRCWPRNGTRGAGAGLVACGRPLHLQPWPVRCLCP